MHSAFLRGGLSAAALAVATVLSSCTNTAEIERLEAARLAAEAEALAARTPPAIALSEQIAQDASIYLTFVRDVATIQGGFADAASIQAALTKGAAYDPVRLSRGMVAYGSIVALQSPEFVSGVRQYAGHPETRQKLLADIVADPRYASFLPGAASAAALVTAALDTDIDALSASANSVENDAYAIQARYDPRRAWAVAHITDREARLEAAKAAAARPMTPALEQAATLRAAALNGAGLPVTPGPVRKPPYAPAVTQALALAALAALGAAGEERRPAIDSLQTEPANQTCLTLSKLMLYQCLAASRPSYEDMFCVGRHVVRDLATCTRYAALPGAVVTVSDVQGGPPPPPAITTAPLQPAAVQTPTAAPLTVTTAPLERSAAPSAETMTPTQRLNTAPR